MKTWGCSHNNSDGEYMAGQLAASGYKITDDHTCRDKVDLGPSKVDQTSWSSG
ncbi:Threonylcarbamoyladenosine tRNA methylthiotransferase [Takifugu flavidus]|uniref:Threonylcarbamoyladenosine tRNA methylthiotransferase n=1 Tax=Takifugu flavidus TaxID=433684 RepID=A0A5C6PMF6_9TELE|nr:Threonylcarbamoyladenosine tRNA methylthiotransferase [Takifugu flavidus]